MTKKKKPDSSNVTISSDKDAKINGDVTGRDKITNIFVAIKDASILDRSTSDASAPKPLPIRIKLSIDILINYITYQQFAWLVVIAAILSILVGGFSWNILNILLGWKFYLGGSGNEPHGLSAFVWGVVTVFPIISFALIACIKYLSKKERIFLKSSTLVLLYTILGGCGGILFYDLGIRKTIELMQMDYGVQEISIVVLWSFILAATTSIPFLILDRFFKEILFTHGLITP